MLAILGNLFIIMFLVGLFNFTIYAFKIRSFVRKNKDNPNIKGVKIVDGQVHVIEDDCVLNVLQINTKTRRISSVIWEEIIIIIFH